MNSEQIVAEIEECGPTSAMLVKDLLLQVAANIERYDAHACTIDIMVPTPRGVLIVRGRFEIVQALPRLN